MTKVWSFTSQFWLVSEVSLPSQKSKSSARFDSPVLALDLRFQKGFFLKHVFSSGPNRLQTLHWDTVQVACSCPLLLQQLHFPVNFSGLREELFAAVPLENKATFLLLSVAVCRLQELSKFFIAFITSAKVALSFEKSCTVLNESCSEGKPLRTIEVNLFSETFSPASSNCLLTYSARVR